MRETKNHFIGIRLTDKEYIVLLEISRKFRTGISGAIRYLISSSGVK